MILGGRIVQKLPLFSQTFCSSIIAVSAVINAPLSSITLFYAKVCSGFFSLLQHLQIPCALVVSQLQVIPMPKLKIPQAIQEYSVNKRKTFALVLQCVGVLLERKDKIGKDQQ